MEDKVSLSEDVLMLEFSQSEIFPESTRALFRPVVHKGNVMIYYDREWPNDAAPVFDTSFPALKGASGAPVIALRKEFPIVGIALANVLNNLRPVQTVRVTEGKNFEETTHYYLPTGQALQSRAIIEFLRSLGLDPEVIH